MAKYHINRETGRPNICHATVKDCPVGGEHFYSKVDAREFIEKDAAVEASKNGNTFGELSKKKTDAKIDSIYKDQEDFENAGYHSSDDRLSEVRTLIASKPFMAPEKHYSVNIGKLNPATFQGSGAEYIDKDEDQSYTILANQYGGSARVIQSYGEFYPEPEKSLGNSATQIKQGSNNDVAKTDLYVVGYVNSKGERYGYVPNKQIAAYVYK